MSANLNFTLSTTISNRVSLYRIGWFEIAVACVTYGGGFIGNMLSLTVFISDIRFRNNSTGILFLLMTISNSIHLWTLTTEFLSTFSIYVYSYEFLECRLNYFVQNLTRAVSTYLVTSVAFDLFIRSELPMRSKLICTKQNALKLSLFYFILFSILFSFWLCPLNSFNKSTGTCYTGPSYIYSYFINNIYFPVRFILVCVIPVLILILSNSRVFYNIRQSHRRVVQSRETIVNSTGTARHIMTSFDRMLFYMMLVNVSTFIITQMPFHIYTVMQAFPRLVDYRTHLLIRAILLIWSSIYFGVAFYLYCLASPLFRRQFIKITTRMCHSPPTVNRSNADTLNTIH